MLHDVVNYRQEEYPAGVGTLGQVLQLDRLSIDIPGKNADPWELAMRVSTSYDRVLFWSDHRNDMEFAALGSIYSSTNCSGEISSYLCEQLAGISGNGLDDSIPAILFVQGSDRNDSRAFKNLVSDPSLLWVPEVILYKRKGSCAAIAQAINGGVGLAVDRLSEALSADLQVYVPEKSSTRPRPDEDQVDSRCEWHDRLEQVQQRISMKQVEKVVVSRRVSFAPDSGCFSESAITMALRGDSANRIAFSLKPGNDGGTLLGVTPETLFSVESGMLKTHALAGTLGPDAQLDDFLSSNKLMSEHGLVVVSIMEQLRALGLFPVKGDPQVRLAGTVSHLDTAIQAHVGSRFSLPDILAALHPTPAIGGYPKDKAQKIIEQVEPYDRGWFAAPIGWLTPNGNAHAVISIRSLWVTDNAAHALVGAGITSDSDPGEEWAETEQKLDNMRSILRST